MASASSSKGTVDVAPFQGADLSVVGTRNDPIRWASSIETVEVDSLLSADSPRLTGIDENHVRTLAEVGDALPPILVNRATMRVIDGMHRLRSAQLRNQDTIAVRFVDGNDDMAFLLAVRENVAHGLPLSLTDRQAAAKRILQSHPELSDRWIAMTTGLAANTVSGIRGCATDAAPQSYARVGRDGRVRPLSSVAGRRLAAEVIDQRPYASLREIAKLSGLSISTARDVRERLRNGENPIPARFRAENSSSVPDGAATVPDDTTSKSDEALDRDVVIANLKRDPSLRYSGTGRAFIRWFDRYAITATDWTKVARRVPPHCAIAVSRVARKCAKEWTELATMLERQAKNADNCEQP
jgi:ParB-like chromosome segregation protein Spo0J